MASYPVSAVSLESTVSLTVAGVGYEKVTFVAVLPIAHSVMTPSSVSSQT